MSFFFTVAYVTKNDNENVYHLQLQIVIKTPTNFRLAIGNRFKGNGKCDWGIKKAGG